MDERVMHLLRRQQESGFADLAGTHAALFIPISDRLINEAIAAFLPSSGRIERVQVSTEAGNRLTARVTLGKPRFLPTITVTMIIQQQPELPESPVLVLRLMGAGGLMSFAGPLATLFGVLPLGLRIEGDRLHVHIPALLQQHGFESALPYLERLQVTTEAGHLIVALEGRMPSLPI
jgi:hypothetical protein